MAIKPRKLMIKIECLSHFTFFKPVINIMKKTKKGYEAIFLTASFLVMLNQVSFLTNPKRRIVDFVLGSAWHWCFPLRPLRTPKNLIPAENEIVSLSSPFSENWKVFRFHRKWKQWSLMNKNAINANGSSQWNMFVEER